MARIWKQLLIKIVSYCAVMCLLLNALPAFKVSAQTKYNLIDVEEVEPFHSEATVEEMIAELPESATMDNPYLFLINADNPIEEDVWMDFAVTSNGMYYDAAIYEPFHALMNGAAEAGYHLQIVSAYRTIGEQQANRQYRINSYLNEGLSEEEALYWTDLYYAQPYSSEHASGLAFDFLGTEWTGIGGGLHEDYAYQPSAIWLAENAHDYGFILRYMEGKTDITGYNFEPWHYRYVGYENAEFIHKHGITLEEFLSLINERDRQVAVKKEQTGNQKAEDKE